MPSRVRIVAVLVGLTVLAAACGSDGEALDGSDDRSADDSEVVAEDGSQDGGDRPQDCPAEPFTGALSRTALAELGHTDVALSDGELIDAAAFSLGAGRPYTAYVASYGTDAPDLGSTMVAPPGEVMVTLAARGVDGAEIEPGVVYDETFVIIDSGGGAENHPIDPTGTVEFIAFSNDHICFKIDFLDENQAMSGTVSARVAGGF